VVSRALRLVLWRFTITSKWKSYRSDKIEVIG